MSVTHVEQDLEALTLTIHAVYDAPPERVWQVWSDPRRLERWWGPPTHPATFTQHALEPDARIAYFMTGPEGERYHGWWRILTVEEPHRLEFEDGFADADGVPDPNLPTTLATVTLTPGVDGGTEMRIASRYGSREAMEQVLAMGVVEGLSSAVGQIDALLLELAR